MAEKCILIVEDDANIREVLKLALDFEGYRVFTATNGKEAFEALAKIPRPGLILLDLMMPIMNGWEFVENKNKDAFLKDIPVVVISAYSERAKTIECTDFVQKPLELEILLKSVRNHFQN
jgi:CheY-like chemotaxis protein